MLHTPHTPSLTDATQGESSDCPTCADSGRAVIGGIDRHCPCPIGRRMSVAHWVEKGLEEAAA